MRLYRLAGEIDFFKLGWLKSVRLSKKIDDGFFFGFERFDLFPPRLLCLCPVSTFQHQQSAHNLAKHATCTCTPFIVTTVINMASAHEQYSQTVAQMEAIEKDIKENQPLTSKLQPLATLVNLYQKTNDSTVADSTTNGADVNVNANANANASNDPERNFIQGSQYLEKSYASWRQVRGDGNCYYRAFLYAILEELLKGCHAEQETSKKELKRLQEYIKGSIDVVEKFGYDRFTIEMFHDELVDVIDFLATKPHESELHEKLVEENSTSDYCTWFLRVITSCYLKADPDRFIHFLDDANCFDVATFCAREVDPMGKECGMVQVLALAEAIGVKVQIEYLDGRELSSEGKLVAHHFGNAENQNDRLEITLLYRPGHYDILYR